MSPTSFHEEGLSIHHERARRRGVNPIVYWVVRAILQPAMTLFWRISRIGREYVPRSGPVILAANHRSFLDPFVIAIHGTEHTRKGFRFYPVKVKVRLGRPLTFPRVENPSKALAAEVTARIWPCIELQWEWLGGLPPLRKAAVIGGGGMGTGVAVLLSRAGLEGDLGCRSAAQAQRIEAGPRQRGD